ncbi:hypothetical protein L7F22_045875 [Adiantum nelumboides]|nr:hypothetical protein [Adiantum nelumboides]
MKEKQQVISRFFAPKEALIEPPSPAPRLSPTSPVQWPPAKTSRNLQNRGASPSPTKKLDRKRPIPPVSGKDETSQVVDLCRPEFCSGAVSLNESAPDSPNHNISSDLNSTDVHSTYKRRRKKEDNTEGHQHSSSVTGEEDSQSFILKKVKPGNSVVNGLQEYLPSKSSEIADIPASDPARHQKFIERLLTTMDSERQASKPNKGPHKSDYTPLEQQVVELKAKYKDVLLMVEVGYRYRMFGEDAEIAARVLGIFAYNDHNFITASIPTFRLHVHVRRLVEAGYKVGVVRQTETAAIKAHGGNKLGPFTRGLSALYSRATLEAAADLGGSESITETENSTSKFLMCVVEQVDTLKASAKSPLHKQGSSAKLDFESEAVSKSAYDTTIGVVAVETASGDVMYGQFKDTVTRSELEAHLLSCLPAELILASPLASSTEKLLLDYAGPNSNVRIERMSRNSLGDGGVLSEVLGFYESAKERDSDKEASGSEEKADQGLEAIMAMPELVVQALVLTLRHLRQFGLERILLLGATFRPFARVCEISLSSNTLQQLEILQNNTDGTIKGSLLWLMDHTHTAFGARLFQHWLTHPLRDESLISARLEAVSEIADTMGSVGGPQHEGSFPGSGKGGGMVGALSRGRVDGITRGSHGLLGAVLMALKRIPDVERGITRIFHGTATASEFVAVIQALLTTVRQLQQICPNEEENVTLESDVEKSCTFRSALLKRLFAAASSSVVSEHASRLLSFLNKEAASTGDKQNLFICGTGKYPMVEKCKTAVQVAERHLDSLLPPYRKLLKMQNLQYMSVSGSTHLIEVPAIQKVPEEWVKISSTKKTNRYHPPEVIRALDVLALAREELTVECNKAWQSFLADFASYYVDFRATVHALAAVDCLYSLAIVSRNQGYTRPEFVQKSSAMLMIEGGRHPVLEATLQEGFVPNDTCLHGDHEHCQIITGPNMGGKSCYIRQVALIAIMAQVGSYVPAVSAKLHAFDAIFTRMGASDSIQRGSSTFLEELSEASNVLRRATPQSLVIMDELGRGTSTHDGVAIAYATLHHLVKNVRCLTLFVTHYPKIAELIHRFPGEVGAYHVSYLAEASCDFLAEAFKHEQGSADANASLINECQEQTVVSESAHKITFLYKLIQGVASRSFGLHVARLAQIPEACIIKASIMAARMENDVKARASSRIIVVEEKSGAGEVESNMVPNLTIPKSLEGGTTATSIAEVSKQLSTVFSMLQSSDAALPAIKMMQECVQSSLGA